MMASQTSITPPPLQPALPTAKEKKYDRQLRLWAASGQAALEEARVLLLNSGPGVVGIEALKNLILPGVGSYTIVDGAIVAEKDLGVNFFLTDESLGKSRAIETSAYLGELNPEVKSQGINKSIAEFTSQERWWEPYTLILLNGPSKYAAGICQIAAQASVPLFYIHSIGFYSHFSVQLPEKFPVVDTHPDPASTQDLRLLNPWPALVSLQEQMTKEISQLDDHAHGHIPYIIILLHYLTEWKQTHDGNAPGNYKEKKEFKTLVESGTRTANPEGGEENFTEAAAAVLKSLNPPSLPPGLRQVFEDSACHFREPESSNFWPIAAGIRDYYKLHDGLLPLPGAIPDMKAQSADYVRLQNVYKQKARDDIAEIHSLIRIYRPRGAPPIPEAEIEAFCKNAAHVKLIRGSPIQIWTPRQSIPPLDKKKFRQLLEDPDSSFPLYLAFQIYDYFSTASTDPSTPETHDLSPPSIDQMLHAAQTLIYELLDKPVDTSRMDDVIEAKRPKLESPPKDEDEDEDGGILTRIFSVLKELDRASGGELHNIAALTGGMVAQEVIKVITKQYVPVDNICVFDGVTSKTAVFKI